VFEGGDGSKQQPPSKTSIHACVEGGLDGGLDGGGGGGGWWWKVVVVVP
jgi:hypothetical protein